MKKKLKSNSLYRFITLLGALAFVLCFYGDALLSPNSYLFSAKGDGVKNYFTYAYHIKNNKSLSNFEGFNYPYGENFLYTDGHPLLVSILKPLNAVFPIISDYSIGILNTLMLLSLLISALVLFQLLRELKINAYLAILGAWAILILGPQIFRIQGHFALSYSFVIPLCFLWLLQYLGSEKSKKHLIYLSLFNALLLFVHAYLGIISISILFAYFLIDAALSRFRKSQSWIVLGSVILSIIPFLIVKKLSDLHEFRTDNPYGFFEYYADVDTIILPHHGALKEFLFNILPNFTQTWEGWSYLGLGTILLLPFILFFFLKNIKKVEVQPINKLLLAATLLLIFSFGIPFRFGLEYLLDFIPILKQFRAVGRFAWVFYFAISIYAFYLLNYWLEKTQSKSGKIALMLSLPVLMIAEGLPYHSEVGDNISQVKNSFNKANLESDFYSIIENIDPSKFQAIIPIPFYNIGSENYEKEASNETYLNSMLLSYHINLPLTSSYLTRVSLQESRNLMQFFAPNFYQKDIQSDIPSSLPFLVIWNKKEHAEKGEKSLLASVQWLEETEDFSIGMLPYAVVFENTAQQEIEAYKNDTTLVESSYFFVSDTYKYFYAHKFDENESSVSFKKANFRNGFCIGINQQKRNNLLNINSSTLQLTNLYEASIWVSNGSSNKGQDDLNHLEFVIDEMDESGSILQSIRKPVMATFIHFEGWSLVQIEFSPLSNNSQLEFYLSGNSPRPNTTFASGLLIRDTDLNLFKILENEQSKPIVLYKNNHSIKTAD